METSPQPSFRDKKVIIFDLDGTLTRSKADMTPETSVLLSRLLKQKRVAVIGGGRYELFKRQLIDQLNTDALQLKNLFLFPTNSTAFYRFENGGWRQVYTHSLTAGEKKKIFDAFEKTFQEANYTHPNDIYGEIIEDRGSQVAFSAHGQQAPLEVKEKWQKERDVRGQLMEILRKHLPEFEVRQGGLTSIDVTRRGINKSYGIQQIEKTLGVPIKDMVFVGDALFPGGNDYAAIKTGIDCLRVSGPQETNEFIESLMK
ncbi:HAD-IIB family hydrolase [Candidatus Wolfebacteria bacterium]|nr:HAD-IIB family hydrolase [Candidatus Wolfebacteria bacterium]